jgi:hypothetical protein
MVDYLNSKGTNEFCTSCWITRSLYISSLPAAAIIRRRRLQRLVDVGCPWRCMEHPQDRLWSPYTTHLLSLVPTSLVFPWIAGSKKSPDNSFRPTQLQSPLGHFIGNSNVMYPNFKVEAAKSHESWENLISDGIEKHFSRMAGIVLWLGIKIYSTQCMRVCLLERHGAGVRGN